MAQHGEKPGAQESRWARAPMGGGRGRSRGQRKWTRSQQVQSPLQKLCPMLLLGLSVRKTPLINVLSYSLF